MSKHFYVTTPIYYVTARPHLGSLYTTVLADVAKRWHQLLGQETFLLTGTDEHGQKIAQAAAKVGMDPQTFVDSFVPAYKEAWAAYSIAYDEFIRTTDPQHVKTVQSCITTLISRGDIYRSHYSGWYCTPCEHFVTVDSTEVPDCPSCGRKTVTVAEECYFFRLSAYQERLLAWYQDNPDIMVPRERIEEVISFVAAGLKDLSISRTTISWGVPFPNDSKHIVYVWIDALLNYLSGIGFDQQGRKEDFLKWWPANVQILGKDIVRFHAVYWPALLMALELPLPKKLLVHGWIKMGEQKMSKSLGNVVDPELLQQTYGADQVRYYLVRSMSISHDSPFSINDLERYITADLAHDLGNLLNRTVALAHKYRFYDVHAPSSWSDAALELRDHCWSMVQDYAVHMNDYSFHTALAVLWRFIHEVNRYFHAQEPWKLAQKDPAQFSQTIAAVCHSLRAIAILCWPVMPNKMIVLLQRIGVSFNQNFDWLSYLQNDQWNSSFLLHSGEPLFAKIEQTHEVVGSESAHLMPVVQDVAVDDVLKVYLVVGVIISCEHIPKSEKLLQLKVDFGPLGQRQILAGVKQHFASEFLAGRKTVFVYNLKPRVMMGLESHGMMLMTKDERGVPQLIQVADSVLPGTRLQ